VLLNDASAFQSPNALIDSRCREMSTFAKLGIRQASILS
jgi:hypothetical protein